MLPDYIDLKNEIDEVLILFMRNRVNFYCCGMQNIPKERLFEGEGMAIKRVSGEFDKSEFTESSTEFSISYEEAPELTINDILTKLDNAAKDMASKIETFIYTKMGGDLERMGRTIDRKGKPFTADTIIEALQFIQIDFDENGKHHNLEMHIPKNLEESVKKAFTDLSEDPALKKKHADIMMQKLEEWRDREASRKLVG